MNSREFVRELFGQDSLGPFIQGQFIRRGGEAVTVRDPATGDEVIDVERSDASAIQEGVSTASTAADQGWGRLSGKDRGIALWQFAEHIAGRSTQLARLECLDTGKPLSQAARDVDTAIRYFQFYAGVADKIGGETIPLDDSRLAYTIREPFGVVAHILPWNSPLNQLARGVAPSLAAGNTVVVKPAELAPLSALYLAELASECGLPPATINVTPGQGQVAGSALVSSPLVGLVTFTGSVETGRAVLRSAASGITPCHLELGGKSATLVFPDCDLAAAVEAGAIAIARNSGQSCFATTRILVHAARYEEYVARLVDRVRSFTVGPGMSDPDVGPLISPAQVSRVHGYVEGAVAEGARLQCGGRVPSDVDLSDGYFYLPTVLSDVTNEMRVAQEEVFGPVQCVLRFRDEDEAVSIANDSAYGLAAGIFSNDFSTIHRVARRLEAGQVQANEYPAGGVETPFGGYKQSGIGREKGLEALRGYTRLKTVIGKLT